MWIDDELRDRHRPVLRGVIAPNLRESVGLVLISVIVVVITFSNILGDAALSIREILVATSFGPAGRLVEPVVNPDGEHTRNLVISSAPDGRWWIMHAETMARSGALRIRHTDSDNSPAGRDVHWSSLQMWNLVALGQILSATNPRPDLSNIEWAALFVGPVTFFVFILIGMAICLRSFGRSVALGFPFAILAARSLHYFFRAGEADHHGLVAMFAMLGVLFILCGRLGLRSADGQCQPRSWFVWSGVMTAAGLWVSAATQVPILAATGVGILLASWLVVRNTKIKLDPMVWRIWGFSGGLASMGFYLLEYFPSHMGLRLEVNNPVYALAWMSGGELLRYATTALNERKLPSLKSEDWWLIGACLFSVALPAALIVIGREQFFVISNKFLYSLHDFFINEFMSAFTVARVSGIQATLVAFLFALAITAISLLAAIGRRVDRVAAAMVVFAACPAGLMTLLSIHQIRWGGTATALYIPLVIASFFSLRLLWCDGVRWRRIAGWCILIAASAPAPTATALRCFDYMENGDLVDKATIPSILTRDISQRIAASDPSRRPVILASPSSSTDIVYYGGAKAIGTLYWENLAGLKAAADIYSTTSEPEALQLIKAHGITHIVLFSWDSFGQRYVRLDRGLGPETEARDGFIPALLEGTRSQPTWLNPLFYPVPAEYGLGKDEWIRIYEVQRGQSRARWLFNVGLYQIDAGKPELAIETVRQSIRLDSKDPAAHLALVMLLTARGSSDELRVAVANMRDSIGDDADPMVERSAEGLRNAGQEKESQVLLDALRAK